MKSIFQNKKAKLSKLLKHFILHLLINYLLLGFWFSTWLGIKLYLSSSDIIVENYANLVLFYLAYACFPILIAYLKVKYNFYGFIYNILIIWLIWLFIIFYVPLAVIYSIRI
ncbi:hypothetical protein NV226_00445 [Mycoplasma iguanae]|uniref:Uncharacterized protein n=1 Tax=Mycoplasma iguanae TaxID=292461 RepID=A0ABY5RC36_9MOLU|nr:hypothetical protein [Mycoplasma iguanae]UVD81775.1 hypothetical protein NV226_00445 [Mycoplasma iguanae]